MIFGREKNAWEWNEGHEREHTPAPATPASVGVVSGMTEQFPLSNTMIAVYPTLFPLGNVSFLLRKQAS